MRDKLTEVQEREAVLPHSEGAGKKRSSSRFVVWLVVLAVVGGAGYYVWNSTHQPAAAAGGQRAGGGRRGQGGGGGAVPVVVTTAGRQDLPVYLDGLGSVQAFYTVTLKSRVDGELNEVDFKEGQDVRKGDQLAVIDPRPYQVALAQAQANLAKDQAQLSDAKLNADRYDQLVKQGVIPQQQSDTQRALANQLVGSVAADQAQIDSAKLNLVYSRITSPIDGRVGLRQVDPGNIVHAADPNGLLVITQLEPIAVIFTLPEDSLPAVLARMRQGALPVKAMSRDNGVEVASGSLQTIDNQIDQTTGTFKLKAVFDNKDRALWPNQFVNARLLLDVQKDTVVIPSAAIQTGSQGTFVYAVKQDKTVEVHPVTVGITEGTVAAITKGLSGGEEIVTDGQNNLKDGSLVAASNAQGGSGNATSSADNTTPAAAAGDPAAAPKRKRSGSGQGSAQGGQTGAAQGASSQFVKPKS
jgi:multidrug efflux system membrane fusion protein